MINTQVTAAAAPFRTPLRAGSVEPVHLHHRRQCGVQFRQGALPEIRHDGQPRPWGLKAVLGSAKWWSGVGPDATALGLTGADCSPGMGPFWHCAGDHAATAATRGMLSHRAGGIPHSGTGRRCRGGRDRGRPVAGGTGNHGCARLKRRRAAVHAEYPPGCEAVLIVELKVRASCGGRARPVGAVGNPVAVRPARDAAERPLFGRTKGAFSAVGLSPGFIVRTAWCPAGDWGGAAANCGLVAGVEGSRITTSFTQAMAICILDSLRRSAARCAGPRRGGGGRILNFAWRWVDRSPANTASGWRSGSFSYGSRLG